MKKKPINTSTSAYKLLFVVLSAVFLLPAMALASSITMQTGDRVIGIGEESPFVRQEDGTLVIQSPQQPQEQQPTYIYVAPEIRWPENPWTPTRPGPANRPVHPIQKVPPLRP